MTGDPWPVATPQQEHVAQAALPDRSARAARRRARRRPLRLRDRPRAARTGHHRRHGRVHHRRRPSCSGTCWTARTDNGTVYTWLVSGNVELRDRLPDRPAVRDHDAGGHLRLADGARLHHRLHGRRSRLPALLLLHLALHLLDADAGDGEQLPAALLRLGSGGPGVLPADRLLVHAPDGDLREPEGVPGEPGRRFRLPARHRARPDVFRHPRLRGGVRQRPHARRQHDRDRSRAPRGR